MTLIIGFKCADGIALVSDTKIIDIETGDVSYDSKILTPLQDTPCMVGLAGYVNLFNEFNRKIPEIVKQRIAEVRVSNVGEMIKTGLTRKEAIEYITSREKCISSTLREIKNDSKNECVTNPDIGEIELPYQYSEENFIDDCKSSVKQISSQNESIEDSLELIIGIRRPRDKKMHLHQIFSDGTEIESDEYLAIGSGYQYAETLFGRVYDYKKEMSVLITEAFRTISYAVLVGKESLVGYTKSHPPEAVVIHNDGTYGKMSFENESQVISEIEKEMENIVLQVKNSHVPHLKPKQ
ncbi:MAG: hypothetical protein K5785_09030 [Nitrosarchaeum sp.]|nr:hypothetical protein [Nitrosarchaeum sp.]